ncbi:MAG: putative membrane-anchored protein [Colwellia sp.]
MLNKFISNELSESSVLPLSLLSKIATHPLREKLYNELHNRPFPSISSPAQLTHIAIQHQGELKEQEHEFIAILCDRFQVNSPAQSMPCFYQDFGLFSLRWERHLEYSTYTFIHQAPLTDQPFIKNALDYVPSNWFEKMPGQVIAAVHLIIESKDIDTSITHQVEQYFDNMALIASAPVHSLARVWSSFKLHDDGFGRFLIYQQDLSAAQLGRLVQQLLQLDTYRLMATLGLPLAQAINSELNQLDLQLQQVTTYIALGTEKSDRELLTQVSKIAAKVEDYRSQSTYRFSATNAYYDVALQRMEELKEDEIPGYMTLQEFLMRRITPAVKTCQTASNHLEDISRRVTRASDLLRTRVDMVLQEQNQTLLKSMNHRAHVQMRLQQTVEGLSVAAISYYGMQLFETMLTSLPSFGIEYNHELVSGFAVPIVIALVFIGTRLIHKRLLKGLK